MKNIENKNLLDLINALNERVTFLEQALSNLSDTVLSIGKHILEQKK